MRKSLDSSSTSLAGGIAMSPDYTPPIPSVGDKLATSAKDLLSVIPTVGAPAKLLIDFVLPSALRERQEKWMAQIGEAVERLERQGSLDVPRLSADQGFLDLLLHATLAALRTRHEEKRLALTSTVAHAAIALNSDRDEELLFVRYVDELSPSHLELLRFLVNHHPEIARVESFQAMLEPYQLHLVQRHTSPVQADLFRLMCADLMARGLLRISRHVEEFPGLRENDVLVADKDNEHDSTVVVTELGQRFVRYVEAPS
jgi:hypothetical protein